MNRYKNGKIYTLRSHSTDKYYIGSTCVPLHKRLYNHKSQYKNYTLGKRTSNISSYEIVKYGDAFIELLEECPCDSKAQLLKREGELIRKHKADIVNINIAGNLENRKERDDRYRANNLDRVRANGRKYYHKNKDVHKKYRENNKDRIMERSKKYYEENRQNIQKKGQIYRQLNKQKIKDRGKKYYETNKDDIQRKCKLYRAKNKDKIAEAGKEYRKRNKEVLAMKSEARRSVPVVCECGDTVRKDSLLRHKRSKKHARNMEPML